MSSFDNKPKFLSEDDDLPDMRPHYRPASSSNGIDSDEPEAYYHQGPAAVPLEEPPMRPVRRPPRHSPPPLEHDGAVPPQQPNYYGHPPLAYQSMPPPPSTRRPPSQQAHHYVEPHLPKPLSTSLQSGHEVLQPPPPMGSHIGREQQQHPPRQDQSDLVTQVAETVIQKLKELNITPMNPDHLHYPPNPETRNPVYPESMPTSMVSENPYAYPNQPASQLQGSAVSNHPPPVPPPVPPPLHPRDPAYVADMDPRNFPSPVRSRRGSIEDDGAADDLRRQQRAFAAHSGSRNDSSKPHLRMGHFLRGIALCMIENYTPQDTIVITPAKMRRYYEETRVPHEKWKWIDMFADKNGVELGRLYRALDVEYHLIQSKYEKNPALPALTPRGFERWMALMIQSNPDLEFERLNNALIMMPVTHPEDRSRRLPEKVSRHAFPVSPDPDVSMVVNSALEECFSAGAGETTDRSKRFSSSSVAVEDDESLPDDEKTQLDSPPIERDVPITLERQRKPYASIPTGADSREKVFVDTSPSHSRPRRMSGPSGRRASSPGRFPAPPSERGGGGSARFPPDRSTSRSTTNSRGASRGAYSSSSSKHDASLHHHERTKDYERDKLRDSRASSRLREARGRHMDPHVQEIRDMDREKGYEAASRRSGEGASARPRERPRDWHREREKDTARLREIGREREVERDPAFDPRERERVRLRLSRREDERAREMVERELMERDLRQRRRGPLSQSRSRMHHSPLPPVPYHPTFCDDSDCTECMAGEGDDPYYYHQYHHHGLPPPFLSDNLYYHDFEPHRW